MINEPCTNGKKKGGKAPVALSEDKKQRREIMRRLDGISKNNLTPTTHTDVSSRRGLERGYRYEPD